MTDSVYVSRGNGGMVAWWLANVRSEPEFELEFEVELRFGPELEDPDAALETGDCCVGFVLSPKPGPPFDCGLAEGEAVLGGYPSGGDAGQIDI